MTKDELVAKLKEAQEIEGTKSSPTTRAAVVIEVLLSYVGECDVDLVVDDWLYRTSYEK